jgi:hypothetical protein
MPESDARKRQQAARRRPARTDSRHRVHGLASPRWHRLEARSHSHWARGLQQRRMHGASRQGQRGRVEAETGRHPQSSPARGGHDLGPVTHFRGHRHCRHSAPPCAHEERLWRTCSPEACLELGSAASAAASVNQRKCTEPPPFTAAPFRRRTAAPAAFWCLSECPPKPCLPVDTFEPRCPILSNTKSCTTSLFMRTRMHHAHTHVKTHIFVL